MLYIIKKNLNILRLNSKNVLNIDSFYFTPKNLIVKFGIDPTKPYLTVGHSIFLIRLNSLIFTDVKIILGVFTSVIGDPTGRSIERPIIKNKHALLNAEIYIKNLKTILVNKKKFKIYVNLWFSKLKLSSFFKFIGDFNIWCILNRLDFKKRFINNIKLTLKEVLYPILQAYDSLQLNSNIEVGGSDQLLNILMVRLLQKKNSVNDLQSTITFPIIVGIDGLSKMSKSLKNYILIYEDACDIYKKLKTISLITISNYFKFIVNTSVFIWKNICLFHINYLRNILNFILINNIVKARCIPLSIYEFQLKKRLKNLTSSKVFIYKKKIILYDKLMCGSHVSIFQLLKHFNITSNRNLRRLVLTNCLVISKYLIKNFFKKIIQIESLKIKINFYKKIKILLIN